MRISNRPQGTFAIRSCVNRDASFGINWSSSVDLPTATTFDDMGQQHHDTYSHHLDTTSIATTTTTTSAKKVLELDEDSSVLSAISDGQLTSTNSSDNSQHHDDPQNGCCDVEVESCGAVDCDLGMTTTVSPLPTKSPKDSAPPIADDDTLTSHTLSRREFCDSQVAQYRAHLEERRRCQDEHEFHRLHYDAMLGDMYQRHNRNSHADGIPSIEFEDSSCEAPNPIDEQAARNRLNSIRHIIGEGARRDMNTIRSLRSQQLLSSGGEDKPSAQESYVRAKYMHRLYWTHVMDDTINLLSSTDHTPLNTPPSYHAYSTVLNRLSQRQMWRGPVSSCYKLVVDKASSSSQSKSVSKRRGGYYHGLIKEAESLRDGSMKLQAWKSLQESTLRRVDPTSGSLFVSPPSK